MENQKPRHVRYIVPFPYTPLGPRNLPHFTALYSKGRHALYRQSINQPIDQHTHTNQSINEPIDQPTNARDFCLCCVFCKFCLVLPCSHTLLSVDYDC